MKLEIPATRVRQVITCSLTVLAVSLCPSVFASGNLDAATQKQLAQLEQKYFGRTYEADSDDNRAERLEKLIFGDAVSGDPAQRIKNIAATTGATTDSAKPQPAVSTKTVAPHVSNPAPVRQVAKYVPDPPDDDDKPSYQSGAATADTYPHISALEKEILGQTYAGQKLPARLSRMESKVFGAASSNSDLSQRTDALDQYAEQKLNKKTIAPDPSYETASGQDDSGQSDYPRIVALEKEILGESFSGQPLPDRLSRMETKAFGNPSKSTDLSQRTDALESYAVKKLHKKPFQEEERQEAASNGSQTGSGQPGSQQGAGHSKFLSMVGNSLLGLAGINQGGATVGQPGAGPGFNPGMSPMGGFGPFGGMRVRSRQQAAKQDHIQDEKPPEPIPDDPLVMAATPPPADTKLLIKVGWCEMQVFGHTSSTQHLAERLNQLNQELNFEPGKSNIELMDHIGALMKTVVAQKQAGKFIGSKAQPKVH